MPPVANPHVRGHPGDADVAIDSWSDSSGYFYVTASRVVRTWATANACHGARDGAAPTAAGCGGASACAIGDAGGATCVGFSDGCAHGAVVLQCTHPGGHVTPQWAPEAIHAFMNEQPRSLAGWSVRAPAAEAHGSRAAAIVLGVAAAVVVAVALLCMPCTRRLAGRSRFAPRKLKELAPRTLVELGHKGPTGKLAAPAAPAQPAAGAVPRELLESSAAAGGLFCSSPCACGNSA